MGKFEMEFRESLRHTHEAFDAQIVESTKTQLESPVEEYTESPALLPQRMAERSGEAELRQKLEDIIAGKKGPDYITRPQTQAAVKAAQRRM